MLDKNKILNMSFNELREKLVEHDDNKAIQYFIRKIMKKKYIEYQTKKKDMISQINTINKQNDIVNNIYDEYMKVQPIDEEEEIIDEEIVEENIKQPNKNEINANLLNRLDSEIIIRKQQGKPEMISPFAQDM